jgi:hypothetical protein
LVDEGDKARKTGKKGALEMRNIVLSIVVVAVLVGATVAGTIAGFVDTEESRGNFIQAGISDLLINDANDPDVPAKVQFDHALPTKSTDFWIDAFNWGKCTGGDLYMKFKDVLSIEAGPKLHNGANYVYDGVSNVADIPFGYRVAVGSEPMGANVWSSEPEKIAEVGSGWVGNFWIGPTNPNLKGEDYATGIASNLTITVTVPIRASDGMLGNPDTDKSGSISGTEYTDWTTAGNTWLTIAKLNDQLIDLVPINNVLLGHLLTQEKTFIHVDASIAQLQAMPMEDYDADGITGDKDDVDLSWWPTNALQGDKATWTMMFTLFTDP